MATGTLAPILRELVLDSNGKPISGALINTYIAGTSTPVATYTDVALSVPNANPIVADSAGRWYAFLTPGQSYKFVVTDALGGSLYTQDNVLATPQSAATLDVTGVAGQTLTAGSVVYLSDGSGAKTAGQWFLADTGQLYSSTTPQIGIVPNAIASGSSGTIRLGGVVPNLTSLTVGGRYYVSTAGSFTTTAPINQRFIGQADTATSIVMSADPPLTAIASPTINTEIISNALFSGICQGRLTLTTGSAVPTADVAAGTTLYFTPYLGDNISLYTAGTWIMLEFSETSIAVPATTSQMYDVFGFNNSGTLALEVLAWTNDSTRATALVLQQGVLVKSGALTRRYLGSFRTTSVSGQTSDTKNVRYLFNYYNRVDRNLRRLESTTHWTYNSPNFREANGTTNTNCVFVCVGVSEDPIDLTVSSSFSNATSFNAPVVALGLDSSTAASAEQIISTTYSSPNGGGLASARYLGYPGIGQHTFFWIEGVVSTGTAVDFWANGAQIQAGMTQAIQSGIVGTFKA